MRTSATIRTAVKRYGQKGGSRISRAYLSTRETKLTEMGLELPPVGAPKGSYVPCVRSGNMLFLAGHLPMTVEGDLITGKVRLRS